MKKILLFFAIILIIAGGFVYYNSQQNEQAPLNKETTISGSLGYPSEEIPSGIKVCAQSINNDQEFCTQNYRQGEKYKKYQLDVEPGSYIMTAIKKDNSNFQGYYSSYVKCGLKEECVSHFPIIVTIEKNQQLTDIDIIDWLDRTRDFTQKYQNHNFNFQIGHPSQVEVQESLRSKEIYFKEKGQEKPVLSVVVHNNPDNHSLTEWINQNFELKEGEFKAPIIFGNKDYQGMFLKTYKSIGVTKEVDRVLYKDNGKIWELNSGLPTINNTDERNIHFSSLVSTFEKTKNEINISQPEIGANISSPLVVEGEARGGWFFEAQLPIELLDNEGNLIASTVGTTQDNWQTEDLVPFSGELEFSTDKEYGKIIVKKDNPSGLPENADQIEIPVYFQK